jgi:hypothetical protein
MAVTLNRASYDRARRLIEDGRFVADERDAWSEHQPSAARENEFIDEHGIHEYGLWHLGVDPDLPRDTKGHHGFPYGDFERLHRCAVLSAESRAAQRRYLDIQTAAAHLHGLVDALRQASTPSPSSRRGAARRVATTR